LPWFPKITTRFVWWQAKIIKIGRLGMLEALKGKNYYTQVNQGWSRIFFAGVATLMDFAKITTA